MLATAFIPLGKWRQRNEGEFFTGIAISIIAYSSSTSSFAKKQVNKPKTAKNELPVGSVMDERRYIGIIALKNKMKEKIITLFCIFLLMLAILLFGVSPALTMMMLPLLY